MTTCFLKVFNHKKKKNIQNNVVVIILLSQLNKFWKLGCCQARKPHLKGIGLTIFYINKSEDCDSYFYKLNMKLQPVSGNKCISQNIELFL